MIINDGNIQKFKTLETSKRSRIINAAMKEFRYGFKKASTDAIVKEAGISKGLLFHYFGTKEKLYAFLIQYCLDEIESEYFDMLDMSNNDILDILWQSALLKKDITKKHPHVYEFSNATLHHIHDIPNMKIFSDLWEKQKENEEKIYRQCDTSLFRDDVDPIKTLDLIYYAIDGFFNFSDAIESVSEENGYDKFLKELREYLDIFRLCFYKNPTPKVD